MAEKYINSLQSQLQQSAREEVKTWWEGYVKESAPFRGVKMPEIRKLLHQWYQAEGIATLPDAVQKDLALALFRGDFTEDKLAGTLFLQELLLPAGQIDWREDLPRFAALFAEGWIYDWNTCDWFCVKVLGPLIQREGDDCAAAIAGWREAENLWQARASLVPFVKVAAETRYYPLIRQGCRALLAREERFAKTAVGWILRDVSKHDRDFVRGVVGEYGPNFSRESLLNALKYFEKEEKRALMGQVKPGAGVG